MNELLFVLQTIITILFAFAALRISKECLIAWVVLQGILANLMVFKTRMLFDMTCVCSDVYAVGCIFGLTLVQEYFGKELAQKTIWYNFFSMLFFVIMSQFQVAYLPDAGDTTHAAYATLLSPALRIMAASVTAFAVGQWLNVRLFSLFHNLIGSGSLALRLVLTLALTQLADTVIFGVLGLYGVVPNILEVTIMAYLVKMLVVLGSFPLTILAKTIIKTPELRAAA